MGSGELKEQHVGCATHSTSLHMQEALEQPMEAHLGAITQQLEAGHSGAAQAFWVDFAEVRELSPLEG